MPLQKPRQVTERTCGGSVAFTLVELLLVIAIVGVLAALLLPTLSTTKAKAHRLTCTNQLKQLGVSIQMYSAEHDGRLPENWPNVPGGNMTNLWVLGNLASRFEATNDLYIRLGKLFPYASQVRLYRCPADSSQANGVARVRSYAMNGWMGSRYEEKSAGRKYRTFVRESELATAGPARLWVMLDEHQRTIDDGWFEVPMDDSRPFASAPAFRHERGFVLSFADGHVELFKLRDPDSGKLDAGVAQLSARNLDWVNLKNITTVQ